MICPLGQVTLKSGEDMVITMVEPPQPDYAERLCQFLEHKGPSSFRGIKQRLDGRYAHHCVDRYFVGEIAGAIAGQVWYGLPRHGTGVGNFGHVYTEPVHRRKGIATELVRVTVEDFRRQEDATCLLCSAGPDAAKVYERFGFEFVTPGSERGPMALLSPRIASSFAELDERYFAPGLTVQVREGHIGDRHDCDRMLDFSKGMNALRQRWHRAFIADRVPSFIDALFYVEDGRGIATVIANSEGRIMGYAFVLDLGSSHESGFKVMDFVIHPNYLTQAALFARETARLGGAARIAEIHAFVAACDEDKLAALRATDFREVHRFARTFEVRGECHDVVVLALAAG